jgi:RES domain-containing protein
MQVYRIARDKYAERLMASGASARWNLEQQYVIYAGASRSLCALELTVHRSGIRPDFSYRMMVVNISDAKKFYTIYTEDDLPNKWRNDKMYPALQQIGSDWYENNKSLVLKVPSAIIPQEYNYIINTRHPDFTSKNVMLLRQEDFFWDRRLL